MDDNRISILAIDDEIGMREAVCKMFRFWGYHIDAVENAKKGIRKLKRNNYDTVLLDVVIPREEFEDNFRSIRKCRPDVPVIIITGLSDMLVRGLCDRDMEEGITAVVYKPFKLKELIFHIENILESRSMEKIP